MAKFTDIEKYLQAKRIDFTVISLPAVAISVNDVVRLSGGQIKRVNLGSGDHLKGLEVDIEDLLKVLSDYKIEDISI